MADHTSAVPAVEILRAFEWGAAALDTLGTRDGSGIVPRAVTSGYAYATTDSMLRSRGKL